MDQRTEFITRALTEESTFTDLCKEYGISRKTGYKWKQRYLGGDRRTVPCHPLLEIKQAGSQICRFGREDERTDEMQLLWI